MADKLDRPSRIAKDTDAVNSKQVVLMVAVKDTIQTQLQSLYDTNDKIFSDYSLGKIPVERAVPDLIANFKEINALKGL